MEDTILQSPNPAGEAAETAGTTMGRFVLLGLLGQGGMGVVYKAYDPQLDRQVALKLLRPGSGRAGSQSQQRLLREAQALARLSHPNVVPIHDVGVIDGQVFLVMEYVPGQDLNEWRASGERSWSEIVEVYRQAGLGLAAAHEAGLIHRDFKPANVRIRPDGRPCVLDFGLARGHLDNAEDGTVVRTGAGTGVHDDEPVSAFDATIALGPTSAAFSAPSSSASARVDSSLTETGAILGTPAYMAPEQFHGGDVDPAADQFSFCVALHEALYGRRPFVGKTLAQLQVAIAEGHLPLPERASPVPDWVVAVLHRGLRPDPASRYPSMRDLLREFESDVNRDLHKTRHSALWLLGGYLLVSSLVSLWLFWNDWSDFGAQPLSLAMCLVLVFMLVCSAVAVTLLRRSLLVTTTSRQVSGVMLSMMTVLVFQRFTGWHLRLPTNDYMIMELYTLAITSVTGSILLMARFWWCAAVAVGTAIAMTIWPGSTLLLAFIGYSGLVLFGALAWLATARAGTRTTTAPARSARPTRPSGPGRSET